MRGEKKKKDKKRKKEEDKKNIDSFQESKLRVSTKRPQRNGRILREKREWKDIERRRENGRGESGCEKGRFCIDRE